LSNDFSDAVFREGLEVFVKLLVPVLADEVIDESDRFPEGSVEKVLDTSITLIR